MVVPVSGFEGKQSGAYKISRRPAVVKGIIGLFSYSAAASQEIISGNLIETTGSGETAVYDFYEIPLF
jgi:hypothetical protein